MLDVNLIRNDFPVLSREVNGRPLIYLDNSATTELPEPVFEVIKEQLHKYEANVHRGIHTLSEESTERMEHAREQMRTFLGAKAPEEIIFTSGTTDSINKLARSLSFGILKPGDEVITTQMEHHANLIPWQEACKRTGATLKVIPIDEKGDLNMEAFEKALTEKTKLVAVTWVSNVTGAVNPVEKMIRMAHEKGTWVMIDGAQAVRHSKIDLTELDADFFVLSGHKMMGPTGTGVLYGKREILNTLPPDTFGGGMVDVVTDYSATYGELPHRLEAGTPNIVGNIGLGAAAEYLLHLGVDNVVLQEESLCSYICGALNDLLQIKLVGNPCRRAGCISFNIEGAHCYDVAKLLDQLGIAVRSGHHCAEPLLTAFGLDGAVRVSPAFYNTHEEADAFIEAVKRITKVLQKKVTR
ncbi:MAG: SufS family cysteine desulfurase [Lachnospiraceae bacterium]|nr:SufS family cysteine desulfurase [Lachnospiraceae bacterium]